MERKLLIDEFNKNLELYSKKQDEENQKKEQHLLITIANEIQLTRGKIHEYIMQIDYYQKQLYLMPNSYKTILTVVMFNHTIMISRLYKLRSLLEQNEYKQVLIKSRDIDIDSLIYLIRKFGANLDVLKNVQSNYRKGVGNNNTVNLYYDLKKIRYISYQLYNSIDCK